MCTSSSSWLSISPPAYLCARFCEGQWEEQKSVRKGGSAVSQCCLSRKLMGARRGAVGRPEPCTIQASFIWSATTGAKHHMACYNTHIYAWGRHTPLQKNCIVQPVLLNLIQTQMEGRCLHAVLKALPEYQITWLEMKFWLTKNRLNSFLAVTLTF